MLYWALVFLIVALVAAALGFGGIAGASAGIAKILFFIFLVLLLVSLVTHFTRGPRIPLRGFSHGKKILTERFKRPRATRSKGLSSPTCFLPMTKKQEQDQVDQQRKSH